MMIAFHRDMIKIHKEYDFLSNGSLCSSGMIIRDFASEDFPMMKE